MKACGWINTQRGQNHIYLIYDGIHYNALILNKEKNQTGNVTLNVGVDLKERSKRKYDPPEAANATHQEPTQANVTDDRTGTNDNIQHTTRKWHIEHGLRNQRSTRHRHARYNK